MFSTLLSISLLVFPSIAIPPNQYINQVIGVNKLNGTGGAYMQSGLSKGFKLDFSYGDSRNGTFSPSNLTLSKRGLGSASMEMSNELNLYSTELYIGSNGDICEVVVDLNTPISWVMDSTVECRNVPKSEPIITNEKVTDGAISSANNDMLNDDEYNHIASILDESERLNEINCNFSGVFHKGNSSTFQYNDENPGFFASYSDSTSAIGIWGADTVGTAEIRVPMVFGIANKTSVHRGTLGLGPPGNTFVHSPEEYIPMSFPEALKDAGIIQKTAFSMFFNKQIEYSGSILFGAVDHKKYKGQLRTVPLVKTYNNFEGPELAIVLEKMYLESNTQEVKLLDQPIGAFFSSKYCCQALPPNVFSALVESMQAKYSPKVEAYKVNCSYYRNSGNLVYVFSGIKIKVPIRDLLSKDDDLCYLAVAVNEDADALPSAYLGLTFLRKAYIVADYEKNELSMAPVVYTRVEDVEVISSSIPRAVKAKQYSSTSLATSLSMQTPDVFRPSNGIRRRVDALKKKVKVDPELSINM